MTCWLVTRHPGAFGWFVTNGIAFDRHVPHLDVAAVKRGDTVMGSLPIHLAAQVCAIGARYLHLSIDISHAERGQELSRETLERAGAKLEEYSVTRI